MAVEASAPPARARAFLYKQFLVVVVVIVILTTRFSSSPSHTLKVGEWSGWSSCPCRTKSGFSIQSRSKKVIEPAMFGGKCGVAVHGPLSETRSCLASPCVNHYSTPCNDRGTSIYLDRHALDCGEGRALQRFQLRPCALNKMKIDYSCVNVNINTGVDVKYAARDTPWNDRGNGHTIFLDRHSVDCGGSGVVQRFRLSHNGRTKQIR